METATAPRHDPGSVGHGHAVPDRLEAHHFWFVGRRELLMRLLDRHVGASGPVLDVGCGSGWNVRALRRRGLAAVGVDLTVTTMGAPLVAGDALRLPFGEGAFAAAVATDVLEHVDDRAALAEIVRVVRPGGVVVVMVPAVPWLWSPRDERAGHRRRYRRGGLLARLREAGLRPVETRYFQAVLFPAVVISRLVARRRPGTLRLEESVRPGLNRVLTSVSRWEVRAGDRVRWPWGSSLAVVARR